MKLEKPNWAAIKSAYLRGGVSCRELAQQFNVGQQAIESRCKRQKWRMQKTEIARKVTENVEKTSIEKATEYLKSSFVRAKKFERMLDASVSQLSTTQDGIPLCEPADLDTLSRSESRVHEWAKSCLRIIPVSQIDHTSGGASLGESFVSAIQKLRESNLPKLTDSDLKAVMECEIVDE